MSSVAHITIERRHGSADYMPARLTVDMYRLPDLSPITVETFASLWLGHGGPRAATATLLGGLVAYAAGQVQETAAPFLTSVLLSGLTYGVVGFLDD